MAKLSWDDTVHLQRELRYGLPNKRYLDFVRDHVLTPAKDIYVDPLAVDISQEVIKRVFVIREHVEEEITSPGCRIVIGPVGSGKTTLVNHLSTNQSTISRKGTTITDDSPLTVVLLRSEINMLLAEHDFLEGRTSVASSRIFVHKVFDTYWDYITAHETFLWVMRRSPEWAEWLHRLRWFYQHCLPVQRWLPKEPDLMAFLDGDDSTLPYSSHITSEQALRALVSFITTPLDERVIPVGNEIMPRSFTRVQILIDGTESFSTPGFKRLLVDIQQLYELLYPKIEFKLFSDESWLGNILDDMECVNEGRVPIYSLPVWNEKELKELLLSRFQYYSKVPAFFQGNEEWPITIPAIYLHPGVEETLLSRILESCVERRVGAPLHTLRLMRAVLAACAGCWEDIFQTPINAADVEHLMDLYWGSTNWEEGER